MPITDQEYAKTLPIQPGMVISGKYRVEKLIAAGGMGAVLQAHHEVLDQRVALKLMRPELASNTEAAQRFLREARAAARIESDFVARVTDVDMWEDTPFMVLEFLNGGDLDHLIESDTIITVSDAVDYVMQALAGLSAAHALGVIHRDLKPANLFLVARSDGSRRVKILDFGISKIVGDDSEGLKAGAATSTQAMLGTPRYMSPEQVSSSKDVDVRTDLWATGLILYELLTKSYPFEGESAGAILASILTGSVPPAHSLRREVPLALDVVLGKFLEKDREKRFANAKLAMRALAPFASRRIQVLLLDPDELQGALAATEGHGTPSEALSSGRLGAIEKDGISMAATALSDIEDTDAPTSSTTSSTISSTRRSGGGRTDSSMFVAGARKGSGGASKIIVAATVAAGLIGAAIYFTRDSGAPAATGKSATSALPVSAVQMSADVPPKTSASVTPPPSPTSAASAAPSGSLRPAQGSRPRSSPPRSSPPRSSPPPKPKDLLNDWD